MKELIFGIITGLLGILILFFIIADVIWNYDLINWFKNYYKLKGIKWLKKYDSWIFK